MSKSEHAVEFCKRIQALAIEKKITQAAIARKLGKKTSQINRWFKNEKNLPRDTTIKELAEAIGCNFEWLKTGTGEMFAYTPPPGDQINFNFGSKKPPENAESRVDMSHEAESFSMKEMVTMTMDILESDTVYRSALASNIRAFHKSVTMEEEMHNVKKQLKGMDDRMQRLEELLLSLGATLPEKREAANS